MDRHDRRWPYKGAAGLRVRSASRDLLVLTVVLSLALVGCTSDTPVPQSLIQVFALEDRKAAPELTGELLDGSGTYDPATHDGKVLVVNFWGSWCAPCVAEAPELDAVYQAHRDEGLAFLGINVREDSIDNARAFAAQNTSYPSIFDPSSRLALGFEVHPNAVPATIVLDRQGRIAAVARIPLVRSELEPVVVALLEEAV